MMIDVKERFEYLMLECLVLSYGYNAAAQTFELVTDSIGLVSGSRRDFIHVMCSGVSEFVRQQGLNVPLQRFQSSYSLRESGYQVVVQSALLTKGDDVWNVALGLGSAFGGVRLVCSAINAEAKGSKVVEEGPGKWRYYDLDSGTEFDFYAPFDAR